MANVELQKVEVEFRDLTKEAQERLYLSDKEKFKNEAANSMYISIRRMVAENEDSSSEFLNAMFREELTNKYKQDEDVINAILSNPKFTIEEETRKLCGAESGYWKYREIVAKDENSSSEFLNTMLREEITNKDKQRDSVVDAIFANPKFTMEEETRKLCAESETIKYRKKVAKDENSSSEFLNAMLREEITNKDKQRDSVVDAIFANPKFTMEEETRKLCAESETIKYRKKAAKDEGSSSEFLNAMLREEITNKDKQSDSVINAILSNPKFTMEEETRKLYAESIYWRCRQIAAEDEGSSSKFLNAMLRKEVTNAGKQDEDVIKAILSNPKFTMEKETRKLCAESETIKYRKKAAEDKGSSSAFLNAMLREEITNEDKQDEDVIKAILSNKNLLLQDDLRNACAEFNNWEVRLMIAKDVETPKELLEAMSKGEEDEDVINAINTNFSNKEKNKQMLEMLKDYFPYENQAVECLEKIKAIIY